MRSDDINDKINQNDGSSFTIAGWFAVDSIDVFWLTFVAIDNRDNNCLSVFAGGVLGTVTNPTVRTLPLRLYGGG